MCKRTLLVVDDDALWAKTLANLFGLLNYRVLTAATCAGGIKLTQLHKPDCILLDFSLPDANGNALASIIKEDPELRKTPIIMVSGEANEELRAHYDYKLDGFFLKGWILDRLLAMVESLLRRVDLDLGMVNCCDLRLDGVTFEIFRDSKRIIKLCPEHFKFLSLLVERSPAFVSEMEIALQVFKATEDSEKTDAIRGVAQRLREKLGTGLGRRIKSKVGKGWGYIQPRIRA